MDGPGLGPRRERDAARRARGQYSRATEKAVAGNAAELREAAPADGGDAEATRNVGA